MKEKIFTVDNGYFILLIAITTLWLTMVTAKGGLSNHTYSRQWWKRVTPRGKLAWSIGVVLGIILLTQDFNNRNISDNKDIDLETEQNLRAGKITKGVNLGVKKETDKIFIGLSDAFRKQGLQYDSIKNEVLRLRDSIKPNTIVNGEPPSLGITSLQKIDSSYFKNNYTIKWKIACRQAVSYNTNISLDVFGYSKESNISYLANIQILAKGTKIGNNEEVSNTILVKRDPNLYSTYVFRLKGFSYKHDQTKIPIDEFYTLQHVQTDNTVGLLTEEMLKSFKLYIKQHNIN